MLASPLGAEVPNGISTHIAERATITNAFRYTDQELAWLGLNAILWDWRVRGDASLLGEFVKRRKSQKTSL